MNLPRSTRPSRVSAQASAAESAAVASEVIEPAADAYAPNKVPTLDYSKVAVEPLFADEVDFDTFSKSDFRAVKVKDCVAVPKEQEASAVHARRRNG